MKGFDNIYRIRTGRIRIVYEIKWKEKIILIHRISYRKDAYK
ncbi:MAG: type II toxin-antitoxin system RelE/ParE family toxin [Thermoplasmata archaeon]|nr:type II toxin-antitoxin system RelE/ParE family toxin [Thermoplasmata archaeon]